MNIEDKIKEIAKKYEQYGCECTPHDCEEAARQMHEWDKEYYNKLLDLLIKSGADADIITNYIENCIEL